ncbi:hypothetical protein PVK06_023819 [Gossypium arboreum]|uniref:Uncharacterized protein n=1 Tax=Gossypium arboreum TaxID=29729 RepID=A0ABR0PC60_GOSAR|nr:hypothetical protein PVK06_023819 [Gossypium arboreum]
MITSLILPMVKVDPGTSVSVLIANIRSQLRYIHRLLLAVAQDDGGRILPIVFAITLGELVNDQDADYLCNIPFNHWIQAYDGGLRYGHMTSNLTEYERKWLSVSLVLFKLLPDRELYRKPKDFGRMTHLDRIKNTEVFEFHKVMGIGNEMSSSTIPRAIPPTTMAYISSIESE